MASRNSNRSDEDLMLGVQRGSPEALKRLFRRYELPVSRFIVRMLGSREDADDVFQETILRIWQHRESYRHPLKFSSWLYAIARNLCRNVMESAWRRKAVTFPDAPDLQPSLNAPPEEEASTRESARRVLRALDSLPPPLRELIVLRYYEGLTFAEAAQVTRSPESTVKSRTERALAALRAALRGQ